MCLGIYKGEKRAIGKWAWGRSLFRSYGRLLCGGKRIWLVELTTPEKLADDLLTRSSGVAPDDIDYFVERDTGFDPAAFGQRYGNRPPPPPMRP